MKLQVMICTFGSLEKVSKLDLPHVHGVGYLISCQSQPMSIPESLRREDVRVVFAESTGLSRNRNNALDQATAPYGLIADDDLEFDAEGLLRIIEAFERYPQLAVATFIAESGNRVHPPHEWDISKPYRNYNISSCEIALNLDAIKASGIRFNENFGVGCERFRSAEENLFLLNVMAQGLQGRFFPIKIVKHSEESTGQRLQAHPGVLRAEGVIIALKYGVTKYPRLLLKAKRTRGNFFRNCFYLFQGAAYACIHRKKLLN